MTKWFTCNQWYKMNLRNNTITKIEEYSQKIKERRIENLFKDRSRSEKYILATSGITLDFSKTNIDDDLLRLLNNLLLESSFIDIRNDLFYGKIVNRTEDQPAVHTLMRSQQDPSTIYASDIKKDIDNEHERVLVFCTKLLSGKIMGSTGKAFTDVVNIGIGGSQTGPEMVVKALKSFKTKLNIHFLSNIDPSDMDDTLNGLNPEKTLFIVVSKSFKTLETLSNAKFVEDWLKRYLPAKSKPEDHFIAVSSEYNNVEKCSIIFREKFKIHKFVGGRYSLWGPAGISIMLALGIQNFQKFLEGASSMDSHFQNAELNKNLPVVLGLIGFWHSSFCNFHSLAIIPYEKRLEVFPKYIQQLQMESNGKSIQKDGKYLSNLISPVVWGDVGTNSQHSFFQYLYQGMLVVPCEFLIGKESCTNLSETHHDLLKLNCLAQSEALMLGNINEKQLAHENIQGNRPSVTLIYNKLCPFNLGALCALYEHKVFVEGVLLEINSFDQFGVQLGKKFVEKYKMELKNNNLRNYKVSRYSDHLIRKLFC